MFKGFDKNLKCRGFQYEVGKAYEEKEANLCSCGFHACENPLDTFTYYDPSNSRYCEVELDDVSNEKSEDSKRVGKKITIKAEVGIAGIVNAAVKIIIDGVKGCKDKFGNDNGEPYAQIGSSGYSAVVSAIGANSIAKAKKGSWIVLAEYEDFYCTEIGKWVKRPICVKAECVDGKEIKENQYYTLKNGKFRKA